MKHVILILFFSILVLQACKKERRDAVTDKPVLLRDKSLAEVKALLKGNWKIHYSQGGLLGNLKTPTPNSFFSVLANDSVYLTLNNYLTSAGIANYQRKNTEFGYSAITINFAIYGGPSNDWIIETIKNDSLSLVDNKIHGFSYLMTKIP